MKVDKRKFLPIVSQVMKDDTLRKELVTALEKSSKLFQELECLIRIHMENIIESGKKLGQFDNHDEKRPSALRGAKDMINLGYITRRFKEINKGLQKASNIKENMLLEECLQDLTEEFMSRSSFVEKELFNHFDSQDK